MPLACETGFATYRNSRLSHMPKACPYNMMRITELQDCGMPRPLAGQCGLRGRTARASDCAIICSGGMESELEGEHFPHGERENLKVEQQGEMLHILYVGLHAARHVGHLGCGAAIAAHLSQTG